MFHQHNHSKISVISAKGFTLIEVMVATAVLALGIVLIYQGFFRSIDSLSYCVNYLRAAPFADEKIVAAQDSLSRFGPKAEIETSGSFMDRMRNFQWNLSYHLLDAPFGLYEIDLSVRWKNGQRQAQIVRSAYAMYVEKK